MRPHRTDILSLVFGLLFLAVAGWWAASFYLDWVLDWSVDLPDLGWLLAGVLILLGLLGIVASLRRGRQILPADAGPRQWDPPTAPVRSDEPVTAPTPVEPDGVRATEDDLRATENDVRAYPPEPSPSDPGARRPD